MIELELQFEFDACLIFNIFFLRTSTPLSIKQTNGMTKNRQRTDNVSFFFRFVFINTIFFVSRSNQIDYHCMKHPFKHNISSFCCTVCVILGTWFRVFEYHYVVIKNIQNTLFSSNQSCVDFFVCFSTIFFFLWSVCFFFFYNIKVDYALMMINLNVSSYYFIDNWIIFVIKTRRHSYAKFVKRKQVWSYNLLIQTSDENQIIKDNNPIKRYRRSSFVL